MLAKMLMATQFLSQRVSRMPPQQLTDMWPVLVLYSHGASNAE